MVDRDTQTHEKQKAQVEGYTVKETHTAKILVQQFNVSVDDLEGYQFVLLVFYSTAKIQTGISVNETK